MKKTPSNQHPEATSSAPSAEELIAGLQPLKPPIEIPAEPKPFPILTTSIVILGSILFLLTLFLVFKRLKKKNQITPEQTAFSALKEIQDKPIDSDAYIMKVSHILKHYLEQKNIVPAVHQTTEEFLTTLQNNKQLAEHKDALSTFLEQCDLIKFACGDLHTEQRKSLTQTVRSIIEQTCSTVTTKP